MRRITILAASAALMLATAATTATAQQQQPAQPPAAGPAPGAPEAPAAAPAIKSVTIVDIGELPEATQAQVNSIAEKTSEADLQKLRSSIDSMAQIKSALEAKGLTSEHVIAASLTQDGALTLVTKKAS